MRRFEDGKLSAIDNLAGGGGGEVVAETNHTDSLLALAWTTWIAVHKLKLATKHGRRLVQAEAASQRAQEAWKRRDHSLMWRPTRKLGGKEKRPEEQIFQCAVVDQTQQLRWAKFLVRPT